MASRKAAKDTLVLYSYWRSSCTWRVRAALDLKGINYDIKPIHLVKDGGEQFSSAFDSVNPMHQVPALVINGKTTVVESISILELLEELYPEFPLLPSDTLKRAKVREIVSIICTGIQPLQNLSVIDQLEEEKRSQWINHFITRGFNAVEKILENSAGKYCVDNDITLADCCLIPQVYNARRFKVDLSLYPNIARIDKTVNDHPAFKNSHPDNQPDCPSKQNN